MNELSLVARQIKAVRYASENPMSNTRFVYVVDLDTRECGRFSRPERIAGYSADGP